MKSESSCYRSAEAFEKHLWLVQTFAGTSARDRKTATSGLVAAPTGQMGRFKNGMLILSSSEIQKIKGRKWDQEEHRGNPTAGETP